MTAADDHGIRITDVLGDGRRTVRRYLAVLDVEDADGETGVARVDCSGPLPPSLADVHAIEAAWSQSNGDSAVVTGVIEVADAPRSDSMGGTSVDDEERITLVLAPIADGVSDPAHGSGVSQAGHDGLVRALQGAGWEIVDGPTRVTE